jgi:hypothetical protein
MTDIILNWQNAFDLEGIAGYELSYRTNSSWIILPFIQSAMTGGTYSFTLQQQVTHVFRIRTKDTGGLYSAYKIFVLPISGNFTISSEGLDDPVDGNNTIACSIEQDIFGVTFSNIYPDVVPFVLNSTIFYTDAGLTFPFDGSQGGSFTYPRAWYEVKSSIGQNYSCLIDSTGLLLDVYDCISSSGGVRTSNGSSTLNGACTLTNVDTDVYWNGILEVGNILYNDVLHTSTVYGYNKYFIVEHTELSYVDTYMLTTPYIVKINNSGVIISITTRFDTCSLLRAAKRSGSSNTESICGFQANITCYVRILYNGLISNGDIVYTNSMGTNIFMGNDQYYRLYLSILGLEASDTICRISNSGVITIVGYCSNGDYSPFGQ